jgi:hypothetical protein
LAFLLFRLVTEDCYPYESGKSGEASTCKITPAQNKLICPSDKKPFLKPLLTSTPSYPVKVESAVSKF